MLSDRAAEATRERAALRLRLASLALGATLLVLAPEVDRAFAAAALLAYAAGALLLRVAVPRYPELRLPIAGIALDVLFASALVSCLPLDEPAWALYVFAIGTAAHRYGAWGAVAATAAAIAAFDVMLGVRSTETRASDLWPIQVLIAMGLLTVELVLVIGQTARERAELAAFAFAQRDLAAARQVDDLLSRLVAHTVLALGATGAAVRVGNGETAVAHLRGAIEPDASAAPVRVTDEIALDASRTFVAVFRERDERRQALVRDLATDARQLLATLVERDRHLRTIELDTRLGAAVRAIGAETSVAAIVARTVMGANSLGGTSTVIRRSDGAVVAGESLPQALIERLRDLRPPALARSADGHAQRVATVAAGTGLALVFASRDRDLEDLDLRRLDTIGAAAGAVLARVGERDELAQERTELRAVSERLRDELRSRDDALASTVHELRTPLTSVTAYGQLISRNLQAALQQLAQLDRLIGDLRREAATALALSEIDATQLAKEAAQRQRLVSDAIVELDLEGAGPFTIRADPGRLGQVLDNVLGNAVKFSPPGSTVRLAVRREGEEIHISIADDGPGLSPEDTQRVFERYYRAQTTSAEVPGLGIGLAVSRDMVQAHGGRIWAESAGPGKGSTFHIALPAVSSAAARAVR